MPNDNISSPLDQSEVSVNSSELRALLQELTASQLLVVMSRVLRPENPTVAEKYCMWCEKTKPAADFYRLSWGAGKLSQYCRDCEDKKSPDPMDVYCLVDAADLKARYVGVSVNWERRVRQVKHTTANEHLRNWIAGGNCRAFSLQTVEGSWQDFSLKRHAKLREQWWTWKLLSLNHPLTNNQLAKSVLVEFSWEAIADCVFYFDQPVAKSDAIIGRLIQEGVARGIALT